MLVDQHKERVEHQELLAGIIASEVANRGVRHPEKWAQASDFMPSKAGHVAKRSTRGTGQRVSEDIRSWVDRMRSSGLVQTT